MQASKEKGSNKKSWHLWGDGVWNFFFFSPPKKSEDTLMEIIATAGNTLHKCSLGCNCSWQNLSAAAGLPGVQTPWWQDSYSQCFCQSGWTSELLLLNYRWILATLRQWAFTIAREVIAFTFKAWPKHKSRIADISWKEASFKSL